MKTIVPTPSFVGFAAVHAVNFRRLGPLAAAGGRARSTAAYTVTEAAVAVALLTVFLTSLFSLNSIAMRMLRSAAEAANASQHLQTRIEQVRMANWLQLTNPSWIQTNLLSTKTDASVNLPDMVETLVVTPYVSPSSVAPASLPSGFTVKRDKDGTTSVSPAGYPPSQLSGVEMLQVDLTATWPSWSRNRGRTMTTLVSRWGVSK